MICQLTKRRRELLYFFSFQISLCGFSRILQESKRFVRVFSLAYTIFKV